MLACSFQSTPSAWRETHLLSTPIDGFSDFNPLPPHGGRQDLGEEAVYSLLFQSTPSAWRETDNFPDAVSVQGFQSTPSAWRETAETEVLQPFAQFQSTPSAWRETSMPCIFLLHVPYFNPLPPHGGRLLHISTSVVVSSFQSTPSAWRETCFVAVPVDSAGFQSTPSAWRETVYGRGFLRFSGISIHSLRMEGDLTTPSRVAERLDFNPLPPHGGRH